MEKIISYNVIATDEYGNEVHELITGFNVLQIETAFRFLHPECKKSELIIKKI